MVYSVADASANEFARTLEVLRADLAAGSGAAFEAWLVAARSAAPDWTRFGALFAAQRGA